MNPRLNLKSILNTLYSAQDYYTINQLTNAATDIYKSLYTTSAPPSWCIRLWINECKESGTILLTTGYDPATIDRDPLYKLNPTTAQSEIAPAPTH